MIRPDFAVRSKLCVWRSASGLLSLQIQPPYTGGGWVRLGRYVGMDALLDEYQMVVGATMVYESACNPWRSLDERYLSDIVTKIEPAGWYMLPPQSPR